MPRGPAVVHEFPTGRRRRNRPIVILVKAALILTRAAICFLAAIGVLHILWALQIGTGQ